MKLKEKRKHKFNFVDAIIIILVLLVIAALVFIFAFDGISLFKSLDPDLEEDVPIYYAVEFSRVRETIWENVSVEEGDEIIDAVKKYDIGDFVDKIEIQSELVSGDNNGNAVISNYPGYKSVIYIIKAEADKDLYKYSIDGYTIQVGNLVSITTPDFANTGYCVALREVSNEAEEAEFIEYVRSMYEERNAITVPHKEMGQNEESQEAGEQ